MKKKKIILIVASLLLICAAISVFQHYLFRPSRNIGSEVPQFQMSADRLINAYNTNAQKADSLYLNKTIEITGIATNVKDSVIQIDTSVFCLFDEKIRTDLIGKKIIVKGKCIGYDELFQEIKLDQCTIK